MDNNGRIWSFWDLYTIHGIYIPKIQRDYVQGRRNRQVNKNRKELVGKLYDALTSSQETMRLNFVYGYLQENRFVPIDGQQRLTTLFLLHVYIFARAEDDINTDFPKNKFDYDTRYTTNRFIESLLKNIKNLIENNDDLITAIEESPWFLYGWKNDMSVVSSVVMLNEIHQIFKEYDGDFYELYEKLISKNCPITFMLLDITDGIGKPNELYIRMNARGKQLTAFENFKADIYGYLDGVDVKTNLVNNMDGAWLDMFWGLNDESIAEKYCDVFYRELLHWIIINGLTVRTEKDKLVDINKSGSDTFKWLSQAKEDEIDEIYLSDYQGIAVKWLGKEERLKEIFEDVHAAFTVIQHLGRDFLTKERIKYGEEKNVYHSEISGYKIRVMLYALTRYSQIKNGVITDDDELEAWYRIFKKLIDNTEIDKPEKFYHTCRQIGAIDKAQVGIDELENLTAFDNYQREEEIFKLQLINCDQNYTTAITKAEKDEYFKGQIYFAFRLMSKDLPVLQATQFATPDFKNAIQELKGKCGEFNSVWGKVKNLFSYVLDHEEDNCLLHRALLCYGDYSMRSSSQSSHWELFYEGKKSYFTWRRLLRENLPFEIFKQLFKCLQGEDIEKELQAICRQGPVQGWKTASNILDVIIARSLIQNERYLKTMSYKRFNQTQLLKGGKANDAEDTKFDDLKNNFQK